MGKTKKKQEKPKNPVMHVKTQFPKKELVGHVNGKPLYAINGKRPMVLTDEAQRKYPVRKIGGGKICQVLPAQGQQRKLQGNNIGRVVSAPMRKWTFIFPEMKRTKVENSSTKIVHMGPYTPDSKIVPSEIHMIEMPHKPPLKMKLLPQTPVGMANAQTSAKFIPQKKKNKEKKL